MAVVEEQLDSGTTTGLSQLQHQSWRTTVARVRFGARPQGARPSLRRLWADANTGYTVEQALEAAPKLADAGVDVLESPLPPNRIRADQALKKQGALPITDEGILSPVEAEEFVELGMMDGIAMKPAAKCRPLPLRHDHPYAAGTRSDSSRLRPHRPRPLPRSLVAPLFVGGDRLSMRSQRPPVSRRNSGDCPPSIPKTAFSRCRKGRDWGSSLPGIRRSLRTLRLTNPDESL